MPASYQSPKRGDTKRTKTVSQSARTNLAHQTATVQKILDHKGDKVFTIRPQTTIAETAVILHEKRIGAVVVTDATGAMQGILSERDIVRQLAQTPGETLPQQAQDLMTRDVETCAPTDALLPILRRMTQGRFRHMPVMRDGHLSGIVTIGDLVNYRLNELEHEALQLKQMIVG